MTLTFDKLLGIIDDWKCDCKYNKWDPKKLKVYVTKSSGKIIFGIMNENQDLVECYTWEQKL